MSAAAKTHKATLLAWVSNDGLNYYGAAMSGDDAYLAIDAVHFHLTPDDTPERRAYWERDHVLIGRADITLILYDPADLANAQLATLRAKKASVLAEAQNEVKA